MRAQLKQSDFDREEANAKNTGKPSRGNIVTKGVYNGKEYAARFVLDGDVVREADNTPIWTKCADLWFVYNIDDEAERKAILEAIKPELVEERKAKATPKRMVRTFEGTYNGKEYAAEIEYVYPDGVQTIKDDMIWRKSAAGEWFEHTPKDKAEHDAIIAALVADGRVL